MSLLRIYTTAIHNTSLQIGDIAYYAEANTSNVYQIGKITEIGNTYIGVENGVEPDANLIDNQSAFLMFAKDARVNTSGLTGYYANVAFSNDSTEKVELFAVSSEVVESSK